MANCLGCGKYCGPKPVANCPNCLTAASGSHKIPTPANITTGLPQPVEQNSLFEVDTMYEYLKNANINNIPELPGPDEPAHVIVLRGLPGSGKSTWAKEVVEAYPPGSVVRINNDDLCTMLYGNSQVRVDSPNHTEFLDKARQSLLEVALKNPDVKLVLVDNTNIATRNLTNTFKTAHKHGASMSVDDRFLAVPEAECKRRNALRDNPVPEEVISRMARQASKSRKWSPPSVLPPLEPYHNDPTLPPVTIVDVDGTLANMSPNRGPFDWHKVGQDSPNPAVVSLVRGMVASGRHVKIFSGRSEVCRAETQAWLDKHVGPGLELHMRPAKDNRPDTIIKVELFDAIIRDKHHVEVVLDDRDAVVHAWRQLGLSCWQVAPGDF